MTKEIQNTGVETMPGPPGLEAFEAEAQYFFRFKDADGNILLRSPGYSSPEKRDQGMETLRKHASEAGHYAKIDAEDQFFFALKSGNHKELFRSTAFLTTAARDQAMLAMQALWAGGKEMEAPEVIRPSDESAPRYHFTIDIYPEETGKAFRGKIAYPLVKEDIENFEGLDVERIGKFISRRLPKPAAKTAKETAKAQGVLISRPLQILEDGRAAPGQRVHPEKKVELELALTGEDKQLWQGKHYKAQLILKKLERHAETMVVTTEGELPANHDLRLKAPTRDLDAGLYRIILHAEIEDPGHTRKESTWEGNSLMLVS